jgi:hypothetical protein
MVHGEIQDRSYARAWQHLLARRRKGNPVILDGARTQSLRSRVFGCSPRRSVHVVVPGKGANYFDLSFA